MTKLEKLYELARNNNKEAIDELFKMNYKLVEKKSHLIYDSIISNLKEYYTELPNGLIDYEDILQDVSLKVYSLILYYFKINTKLMLSSYISHNLSSYINYVVSNETNKVIYRLKNSINENINFQFREINEDRDIIFELIDLVNRNPKFNSHHDFISDIFNGYNYQEIALKYNLHIRGMSVKMRRISNIYNNLEQDNIYVNYIKNILINELNNGDLYKLSYFKDKIIFTLHDIYIYLKNNYYLDYHIVKDEFIKVLCTFINRSKGSINSNTNIDNYINNILLITKDSYLKNKTKELDYIKSGNYSRYYINNQEINKDDTLELLKKGKIYQIYPYCDLINMIIEEITTITNKEKRRVKFIIKVKIDRIINKFIKKKGFTIEEFNNVLKDKLKIKENNKVLVKK